MEARHVAVEVEASKSQKTCSKETTPADDAENPREKAFALDASEV